MKRNLTKFFNLIKKDKQAKTLIIIGVLLLLIFIIGYSLSMFTDSKSTALANIKVKDLVFNMTTNSGTSDDRVLHLQAGKTEKFDIVLTNLNKVDVKYEIIYELCNDSNCTSTSKDISNDIQVNKFDKNSEVNGTIVGYNKSKTITIITRNNSKSDYYIKLSLNAGYSWNELELANQINNSKTYLDNNINVVAYVDGNAVSSMPTGCAYTVGVKIYDATGELTADSMQMRCNYYTMKWSMNFNEMSAIPTKIVLSFTKQDIPDDMLVKDYDYTTQNPMYVYDVPTDGYYNLEVWGSQGNQTETFQGFGGYSQGVAHLTKGQKLYIYLGGQDAFPNGGTGSGKCGQNGGGSTHIAFDQKKIAEYTAIATAKERVVIVAGGGGGQLYNCSSTSGLCTKNECIGGNAGGYQALKGYVIIDGSSEGGGQAASGSTKFGVAATTGWNSGGNGGGWYGGANGRFSAGGGGSSFIDSTVLASVNKRAMYCYGCTTSTDAATRTYDTKVVSSDTDSVNCPVGYSSDAISKCAKSGNGHARITFINNINI